MKTNRSTTAILLALTAAAGIAACSHDKTRDETAMRDPVTAADTPTAVNSDDSATYIHTAKTSEESPSVDVAQMESSTPAATTTTNNTLPSSSSSDEVQAENARFETANRK